MRRNLAQLARASLLAFAVAVAFAFVNPAEAQYLARYIGGSFRSTAANGQNGFACQTNGCRIDLGTGANDYLYSNGTDVLSANNFAVSGVAYARTISAAHSTWAGTFGPLVLRGNVAATAAAGPAVKIGNVFAVNAIDGKIVSFYSDDMTTEKAYVDADGAVKVGGQATLPTCAAGKEGLIFAVPGAAAVPTKICACLFTPTGAVYAWRNLNANSAGTGVGNSTTCP